MENLEEKPAKKKITRRKTTSKKSTTAKKTTTSRKPRIKKQEAVVMPTKEEIQAALKDITNQKKIENNINQPRYEEVTIQDAIDLGSKIDDAIAELLKEPVSNENFGVWQPVMNVLTRMYETSEDDYQNVKYIGNNRIVINLDKKIYSDVNKEINRIRTQLSMDTLSYEGVDDKANNRIAIIIRKK